MKAERLTHLTRQIATITSLDELDGFRQNLTAQGELTTDLMAVIRDRQDVLARVATKGIK